MKEHKNSQNEAYQRSRYSNKEKREYSKTRYLMYKHMINNPVYF